MTNNDRLSVASQSPAILAMAAKAAAWSASDTWGALPWASAVRT
jgi:hypothetical protein